MTPMKKRMNRRQFITSSGTLVGGLLVAGCTEQSSVGNTNREDEEFFDLEGGLGEQSEENLKVTNLRLFKTAHGVGILGKVKNVGKDIYTRVSVKVVLTDENNNPIQSFNESIGSGPGIKGVASEAIGDLKPGQIWKFTIFFEDISSENIASYRLIVDGEVA